MAIFKGPYLLKKTIGNEIYIILDSVTFLNRGMFHANDIRKYHSY